MKLTRDENKIRIMDTCVCGGCGYVLPIQGHEDTFQDVGHILSLDIGDI